MNDSNIGINEYLAEMIGLNLMSPELANDVLKGEITSEEALDIHYYSELMLASTEN